MQGRQVWFSLGRGVVFAVACGLFLTGCGGFLPSSGISAGQAVSGYNEKLAAPIEVLDIDRDVVQRVLKVGGKRLFSNTLGARRVLGHRIGPGDVLEVSVWEAPPASLFGTSVMDAGLGTAVSNKTVLPEQMVNEAGTIRVPFAGRIDVAGYSALEVEEQIVKQLHGKANQPQVLVRVIKDASSTVTIVGDVAKSTRMSLTPKHERLLDVLAVAGGVRESIGKTSIQVTRGNQVHSLPLDLVISDPRQNILLQAGDVITVLSQPMSFTVLGATGKNEEVNFAAKGISLAQALARSGGLNDGRADAKGVFVFRFEHPTLFGGDKGYKGLKTAHRVPIIYRLDMKDPGSFLLAQQFPIRNSDMLFVSNAPSVGLQKFLRVLHQTLGAFRGGAVMFSGN
ncbi:MAG: polysaccharide export protein [Gammaproteobacteria bacterium]|nr:polysaccharide export protein [Gammaproteobacteria bacterium]